MGVIGGGMVWIWMIWIGFRGDRVRYVCGMGDRGVRRSMCMG